MHSIKFSIKYGSIRGPNAEDIVVPLYATLSIDSNFTIYDWIYDFYGNNDDTNEEEWVGIKS